MLLLVSLCVLEVWQKNKIGKRHNTLEYFELKARNIIFYWTFRFIIIERPKQTRKLRDNY